MNDPKAFDPLAKRSWTDLGPRAASAAVLIVMSIVGLYVGSYVFAALVGAVFAGCYREWERMVTLKPTSQLGWTLVGMIAVAALIYPALGVAGTGTLVVLAALIAGFADPRYRGWRVVGTLFFGIVSIAVLLLRGEPGWYPSGTPDVGFWAGLFLAAVIWMTDTGAYFTGRQVGGEKLAPGISPGKTWSGAIGGFAFGTLAGLVLWLLVVPGSPWWIGLLLAAGVSVVGQVGDLVESAVKRYFRIKDSGDLLPGHGGLMDRLDSLTFGALFLTLVGGLHHGFSAVASGILLWS